MSGPDLGYLYQSISALPAVQRHDVFTYLATAHPVEFEDALKDSQLLAQAAAIPANPCGPYVSPYTAKSAAEVAEGLPHLHQSSGGHGGCTFPGCPQGTLHPGYYEGYYDDQDAVS